MRAAAAVEADQRQIETGRTKEVLGAVWRFENNPKALMVQLKETRRQDDKLPQNIKKKTCQESRRFQRCIEAAGKKPKKKNYKAITRELQVFAEMLANSRK